MYATSSLTGVGTCFMAYNLINILEFTMVPKIMCVFLCVCVKERETDTMPVQLDALILGLPDIWLR